MAPTQNNVNNTDINSESEPHLPMPMDVMGLFFFAYRDFVSDADALLARHKFGRAHHRVLYFVNIRPGMSVATLLSILKITKQSLARVLRQLIDNGYIKQNIGDNDRRQRLLFPTQKGRDFFATLSESQASRINTALAGLPPETANSIRRFFIAMIKDEDRPVLDRLQLTSYLDD
ncbi:HTH-type transcriptional regulator PetP [hydrothermal vent metagenome]|uniref:HTH-type transcriptional regulator PetP n=1 Tax=hydrothermal vent metagenome TaxID=652676 RepID=A0A3B0TJM9_9ZZZZ